MIFTFEDGRNVKTYGEILNGHWLIYLPATFYQEYVWESNAELRTRKFRFFRDLVVIFDWVCRGSAPHPAPPPPALAPDRQPVPSRFPQDGVAKGTRLR
jgi:hypothetical protein